MRSAWIKWARGVEHQRVLARAMREFSSTKSHEYVRVDNARDADDMLVKAHWRLRILEPFPECWSVLLGDVLTNFRAVLDHTFWAAAVSHSGQPDKPQRITFPIATKEKSFKDNAKDLQPLVPPAFWDFVEAIQPFHAPRPHTVPLESLRWLSNVDKHRAVHVVGRVAFDAGPIIVDGDQYEVVEEERFAGELKDNDVVARLKFKRPAQSGGIQPDPHLRVLAIPPGQRGTCRVLPTRCGHGGVDRGRHCRARAGDCHSGCRPARSG